MTLVYLKHVDIVHFKNDVDESLEERLKNLDLISEFCNKCGSHKIIFDLVGSSSKKNFRKEYQFARRFRTWRSGYKIAVVYSSKATEFTLIREFVMNHSGKNLRRQQTVDEAIDWLLGE